MEPFSQIDNNDLEDDVEENSFIVLSKTGTIPSADATHDTAEDTYLNPILHRIVQKECSENDHYLTPITAHNTCQDPVPFRGDEGPGSDNEEYLTPRTLQSVYSTPVSRTEDQGSRCSENDHYQTPRTATKPRPVPAPRRLKPADKSTEDAPPLPPKRQQKTAGSHDPDFLAPRATSGPEASRYAAMGPPLAREFAPLLVGGHPGGEGAERQFNQVQGLAGLGYQREGRCAVDGRGPDSPGGTAAAAQRAPGRAQPPLAGPLPPHCSPQPLQRHAADLLPAPPRGLPLPPRKPELPPEINDHHYTSLHIYDSIRLDQDESKPLFPNHPGLSGTPRTAEWSPSFKSTNSPRPAINPILSEVSRSETSPTFSAFPRSSGLTGASASPGSPKLTGSSGVSRSDGSPGSGLGGSIESPGSARSERSPDLSKSKVSPGLALSSSERSLGSSRLEGSPGALRSEVSPGSAKGSPGSTSSPRSPGALSEPGAASGWSPGPCLPEESAGRTVEVVVDKLQEDLVYQYYFSNPQLGGGPVERVQVFPDRHVVWVTFCEEGVAARVSEVEHVIGGVAVKVRLCGPCPVYPDKLLVSKVPDTADQDTLTLYLELVTAGCRPTSLRRCDKEGDVLATFDAPPDFARVEEACARKPLRGSQVMVRQVPVSRCVLVQNLHTATLDYTVQLYFENHKRSGGGAVDRVQRRNQHSCLVHFSQHSVVDSVLAREHTLDDRKLEVCLHVECVGESGGRRHSQTLSLPAPFSIRAGLKSIFLQHKSSHLAKLQEMLHDLHASVRIIEKNMELQCSLKSEMPNAVSLARSWTADVQGVTDDFLDSLKEASVEVSHIVWTEVVDAVNESTLFNRPNHLLVKSKQGTSFTVVGVKADVDKAVQELRQIVQSVEKNFERSQEEREEVLPTLEKHQLRLLSALDFKAELVKRHPKLKVSIGAAEITFRGLFSEIKDAEVEVFKLVHLVHTEQRKVGSELVALVRTKIVEEYLHAAWNSAKVVAVMDIESEDAVRVHAVGIEQASQAAKILTDSIKQRTLPLSVESARVVQLSPDWRQLVDSLLAQHRGLVRVTWPGDNHLKVTAVEDILSQAVSRIQIFLDKNTIFTDYVRLSPSRHKFLVTVWRDKVGLIVQRFREDKVELVIDSTDSKFLVKGNRGGLKQLTEQLRQLESQIHIQEEKTDEDHAMFRSSDTYHRDLERLEREHRCVVGFSWETPGVKTKAGIEEVEEDECPVEERTAEEWNKGQSPRVQSGKEFSSANTSGHVVDEQEPDSGAALPPPAASSCPPITVTVVSGEIAQQQVDVIVNSTSTSLDLSSGAISSSLLQAAGPGLQQECRDLHPQGVSHGDVAATSAHGLHCQQLYHLSLPDWNGPSTTQMLLQATMKCLTLCSQSNYTSIAMPALGTGNLSYPRDVVAQTMMDAVSQFQQNNPYNSVREVKLVVYHKDSQTLVAFQQAEKELRKTSNKGLSKASPPRPSPPVVQAAPPLAIRASKAQGIAVNIVPGEIAHQKFDVIVNSTSSDLDLRTGAISGSILKAAGPGLQKECGKKYPGGLTAGQVASTGPHGLGCKVLYHVTIPAWSASKSTQVLQKTVVSCLDKCSKHSYTSIAIPAMGTGNLSYPRDVVAQTMLRAVHQFQQTNPSSSLREVRLVIYHMDNQTLQAFHQAQQQHSSTSGSAKSTAFGKSPVVPHVGSPSQLVLNVISGGIVHQKVDVIVNSTGSSLDLDSGAISSAILKAAGSGLQDECRRKYPTGLSQGQVGVTGAHSMHCRQLLHISLPSWAQGAQNKQILEQSVLSCLDKCSQGGFSSIAIPALGTGNLSYPKDVVAQTMIGAVHKFLQNNPSTSLREVRMVIYHKDTQTFQEFQREHLQNPLPQAAGVATTGGRRPNRRFSDQTQQGPAPAPEKTSSFNDWNDDIMGVKLIARQGDVTTESTDVIVNPLNKENELCIGSVSTALRQKCGQELETELQSKRADIEQKGIAVTKAPKLRCRLILHVDKARFARDWQAGIRAMLQEADKFKVKSIALPALGMDAKDAGSTRAESLARDVHKAVVKHVKSVKQSRLQSVVVVMSDPLLLQPFTATLHSLIHKTDRGLWGKFKALWGDKSPGDGEAVTRKKFSPSGPSVADSIFIYGESRAAIQGFLRSLAERVKDKVCSQEYSDNVLQTMDRNQLEELERAAREQGVRLTVEQALGRYTLHGLTRAVPHVHKVITDQLRAVERRRQDSDKKAMLASLVQWSFLERTATGTRPENYGHNENVIIEEAYSNKQSTAELVDADHKVYVIDFERMVEFPKDNPSSAETLEVIRKVKGEDSSKIKLPAHWEPHAPNEPVKVHPLKPSDQEYSTVESNIRATLGNTAINILSVDRIQNEMLYQQYAAKKTRMERENGAAHLNEKTLWHGTAGNAIQNIYNHGFNRSYCGKNATAHGQGVYFAVNSSYSTQDTYSPADSGGQRYLFQCRVLTGHATKGKPDMRWLPPRHGQLMYDSATNNPARPDMYVIFNDTQAYPEYLITFQ